MSRGYSPQDLDPIGGLTARMMTIALSTAAVLLALGLSLTHLDQVVYPAAQAGALLSISAAAGVLVWNTDPYRAPFRRSAAIVFACLCVLSDALDALSQHGANTSLRDDFPPIGIALMLLMVGSYRPAREAVQLSLAMCLLLATVTVIQLASFDSSIGTVLGVIVTVTPVLAAGVATTAFSRQLVSVLLAWRHDSVSAQRDAIDGLRSDLVPAVRAERLQLLETEVLPFLRNIVETGVLSAADSDRSRDLAAGLREVMSPDSGSNWLEELADSVDDPERLLERMGGEQRGSLRALLVELRTGGHVAPGTTRVEVRSQDKLAQATIRAAVHEPFALRASLAPYFAVARSFLPEATLVVDHSTLVLEFRFPAA